MSARSLNKVMLIGNLTRDPELRYTGTGTPVCTFGIATNRAWKDASGEAQEAADFHNIVAWSKLGEICAQLLTKGMKVYIEGSLHSRSWEGEDGVTKYKTEIRVEDMIILDSKGKTVAGAQVATAGKSAEELLEEMSSDSTSVDENAPKKDSKKKDDTEEKVDEDPLADMPF